MKDNSALKLEKKREKALKKQQKYYMSSQWALMGRKLIKHKLADISFILLFILYFGMLFADFLSPYTLEEYSAKYSNAPPTKIHFIHEGEFIGPFVYDIKTGFDEFEQKIVEEDTSKPYKIKFFVEGKEYSFLGLESNIHFVGVEQEEGVSDRNKVRIMIFGADQLGRDLYSRILLGSQVSLTVPLLGTAISFLLALLIGGISGYYGGIVDTVIQRIIEVFHSFPNIPLWMALSAAIPVGISVTKVYIMITLIMSLISWPGLARTVRSKFLSLKKEDYVTAAKLAGVSDLVIIFRHLVPGFMSYLIVSLTLGIPGMIIGETSMSYLGLGMRAPATSWGVLLQECQSISNIANCPWKLIPVAYVMATVLAFNFLGDGMRDAADPYKSK